MKTPRLIASLLTLFTTSILITGCGEKDGGSASSSTPAAPAADGSITIEANDLMKFNLAEFSVVSGKEVKLTLKNVGKLPKQAMGHNLVILKTEADVQPFATAAPTAVATEYIPEAHKDKIIAHTKLLGAGESDTITITAPAPGKYPFICSFPGHFALMRGNMIVTAP
ncbi:MAG: azurin [Prosthecobacter sp.]|nr:azurin [Prosthecobacter sp.]